MPGNVYPTLSTTAMCAVLLFLLQKGHLHPRHPDHCQESLQEAHADMQRGKRERAKGAFSLMQLMYKLSMSTGLSLLKKGGRVTTK